MVVPLSTLILNQSLSVLVEIFPVQLTPNLSGFAVSERSFGSASAQAVGVGGGATGGGTGDGIGGVTGGGVIAEG